MVNGWYSGGWYDGWMVWWVNGMVGGWYDGWMV